MKRTAPLLFLILFAGLLSGKLVWSVCPPDGQGARTGQPTPEPVEEHPNAVQGRSAGDHVQGTTGAPSTSAPAAPVAPAPAAPAPRTPAPRR